MFFVWKCNDEMNNKVLIIGSHSIQFNILYLQQRAEDEELRSLHSSAIFTTEMSGPKIESVERSGLDNISLAKT